MNLLISFLKGVLKGLIICTLVIALAFPYFLIYRLNLQNKILKNQVQEIYDNQVADSAFLGQVALLTMLIAMAVQGQGEAIAQLQENAIDQHKQTTDVKSEINKVRFETNNKVSQLEDTVSSEHSKPSYDYLKSVTVIIFQDFGEGHGSLGTGVVLKHKDGHSYILTNKHVCDYEAQKPCYVIEKGTGQETEKIEARRYKAIAADYDAQILETQTVIKDKQEIKGIAKAKPQDGVYLVGHHLGRPYVYGEGVFAGYDDKFIDIIQIPILWGDSGSGVFDRDGNLVALMFAGNAEKQEGMYVWDVAHGLAVDSDVIAYLVKGL